MHDSWDVITGFIARHSPGELARFRPPASEANLRAAEHALGAPLPDSLKGWWRHFDGVEGNRSLHLIPPLYTPYSVEQALQRREGWLLASPRSTVDPRQHEESHEETNTGQAGSASHGRWLPQWLPIASDGGGDDLFIDLRPGPAHGCIAEFSPEAWDYYGPAWSGISAMLSEITRAMLNDAPVRGFRIWADEEGIAWDRDRDRWAIGGGSAIDPGLLRQRFDEFVSLLRSGAFVPPPAGSWSAEWIAAHVQRNLEILIATTEHVAAGDPADFERRMHAARTSRNWTLHKQLAEQAARVARTNLYDNSDAMDPAVLNRYAGHGLPAIADEVERLSASLCEVILSLRGGRPAAQAHIVDDGAVIIDGMVPWWGVLWALHGRQLPRRIRQLEALHRPI